MRDDCHAAPPQLAGYTFDPESAYAARDEGRLLAVRLETNQTCNLLCRYCYADSHMGRDGIAPLPELVDRVEQARNLGARSIIVIGGGEPTLHPQFLDLIEAIHHRDMRPVVFTNCLLIDRELAGFLYDSGASVMGKLDSLRPEVQDDLAGRPGAAALIRRGIDQLLDAGFGSAADLGQVRMGLSFVTNRRNLDEVEAIWRFCRERNIFPNMEVLTPTGRADDDLADATVGRDEIRRQKELLLELDRFRYGYDWLPYTPLAASGCLQHLYSLYITLGGDVRPCAPTKFDEHPGLRYEGRYPYNVTRMRLADIYNAPLFRYVRDIDRHLEGKCERCPHLDECIGCRGYAYATGIKAGLDPCAALRQECAQCHR